jgi:hypothetical protein
MSTNDPARALLRHTLATLWYRAEKSVRGAPPEFATFRIGPASRTAGEILAHVIRQCSFAPFSSYHQIV